MMAVTEEVIERLRASKAKAEIDDADYGRDDGRRWAEKDAEYPELERLSQVHPDNIELSPFDELKGAVDPNDDMNRSELCNYCLDDEDAHGRVHVGLHQRGVGGVQRGARQALIGDTNTIGGTRCRRGED
jgi:hypothetical protein